MFSPKYWKIDTDSSGRVYAERTKDQLRLYQLDPVVAKRIKDLRTGADEHYVHTWRAIAMVVAGFEDQYTGKELCELAAWTLGEEDAEWI